MTVPSFQDAAVLLTRPLRAEQKEGRVWVNNNAGVASAVFHLCLENACNHLTQLTTRMAFQILQHFMSISTVNATNLCKTTPCPLIKSSLILPDLNEHIQGFNEESWLKSALLQKISNSKPSPYLPPLLILTLPKAIRSFHTPEGTQKATNRTPHSQLVLSGMKIEASKNNSSISWNMQ